MASKPNFSSVLDRPSTEIERPKPLPVGTYLTVLSGLPRYDKSSKKQTDFIEFTHKFVAAEDDVDKDELEAALARSDGSTMSLDEKSMTNTYYLTEGAAWRLKEFLEHLGFDMDSGKVTMRQAAEDSANREVFVIIRHEASEDGKAIFARIRGTAAVG